MQKALKARKITGTLIKQKILNAKNCQETRKITCQEGPSPTKQDSKGQASLFTIQVIKGNLEGCKESQAD